VQKLHAKILLKMSAKFNTTEVEKLAELRKRIGDKLVRDYQKDDEFLIKWLRARSMNVDQAEKMLTNHLEWRKTNEIDGIEEREEFPEKYRSKFPYAVCGQDADGCPLIIFPAGRHDIKTILETETVASVTRLNILMMEKIYALMRENSKKVGKPVTQVLEIMDFEGIDYAQMTSKKYLELMMESQKVFNDNYPEMIKKAFVVNAPKVFAVIFNVMKPLIPKETLDKIEIFGSDKSQWKAAIAEAGLPLDIIPPHWGGTMQGTDDLCSQSDIWVHGKLNLHDFNVGRWQSNELMQVHL